MMGHDSRNSFTHVGTDGWTMNLDHPDYSMNDGDEFWLGQLSKISGSLLKRSPEILWTWMNWNVNANPFLLMVA